MKRTHVQVVLKELDGAKKKASKPALAKTQKEDVKADVKEEKQTTQKAVPAQKQDSKSQEQTTVQVEKKSEVSQ
jgi:hypothetical protein